jgi:hypothetical protein
MEVFPVNVDCLIEPTSGPSGRAARNLGRRRLFDRELGGPGKIYALGGLEHLDGIGKDFVR